MDVFGRLLVGWKVVGERFRHEHIHFARALEMADVGAFELQGNSFFAFDNVGIADAEPKR